MPQFQHLRLGPHKGLQTAELLSLGRINVICGPNNSGKTTVLESIASDKLRSQGVAADSNLAERLASGSLHGAGWDKRDQHANRRYFSIVEAALKERSFWFDDQFDEFWDKIGAVWRQNFGNIASPALQLKQQFEREFDQTINVVLVPPKRRLETYKQADSSETIQTDGTGLLNFLFMAKNQDESAKTRQDFQLISESFRDITQGFDFQVFLRPKNQVDLLFRRSGNEWIRAEDCGLGLQDILIILYYGLSSDQHVVLIEEPENHLHPDIQRRLFSFIRHCTKRQFFLSTHSSVFLSTQVADRVFLCRFDGSVAVQNATNRAAVLSELGYSIADNLVSDVIVLCEGPTDKIVLEEFFRKMGLYDKMNIKAWPLGGDIMDQLDLSVFSESYKVVALIDQDPGSSTVRKRFLETCNKLRISCHRLERYSLENYFSIRAIKQVMGEPPRKAEELTPDKPIAEQLGYEVKRNAAQIAKEMELDEIRGTDLLDFLEQISHS